MEKNYKARMTAANMQITERNKESLIRLMIFASQIGEFNQNEAVKTVRLSKRWRTANFNGINNVNSLRRLKETGWLEKQDISDYIAILVDILSESDFFDIQQTLISTLNRFALDYKDIEPNVSLEVLQEIKFSNTDFSNQFYENSKVRNVSASEKYANLMYLSNQLAHAFSSNVEGVDDWQRKQLVHALFKIKLWCIHNLIKEKANGDLIDIAFRKNQDMNENNKESCIISFSLPNYMEPFSVHTNESNLTSEELKQCDGIDRFYQLGLKTSFPQYFSDNKMRLLEHLYKEKFQKGTYIRGKKLQWLFETKELLQEKQQRKIKNAPASQRKKSVMTAKDTKVIDINRENSKTFRKLSRKLGTKFPKYFMDGFLHRTSYSLKKYIEDVKPEITAALLKNGIPVENIDSEIAKLIIFMKLTKPLGIIARKPKEEKKEHALEAIKDYSDGYTYIELYVEETNNFSELRSGARKYANELVDKRLAKQQTEIENNGPSHDEIEANNSSDEKDSIDETKDIQGNKEESLKLQEDKTVQAMTPERAKALEDEITQLNTEVNDLTNTIQVLMERLKKTQERIVNIHTELKKSISSQDEGRD